MRTSVTLGYLLNGVPIRRNREICIIDTHPGIAEAVSWTDLVALATATYQALQGDWTRAGAASLPLLKRLYEGKDPIASSTEHLTYQQNGSFVVNGQRVHPNEIRVVFRATSEDSLTDSLGRAEQSEDVPDQQIKDNGEKKEDHMYTRRFSVPLKTIAPGDYLFTFGSGDDGWFFNVGANTMLTLTIAPPPL